jgi:hypothetical protein
MDLKIKEIKVNKKKIPQCELAEAGILPTHPFRCYIIGASQSGKTNLMLNLLTRDDFYSGYFDHIFVLSPTACHLDVSYQKLNLPEENFFMPDVGVLNRIREIQEAKVKKVGIENAPKVCIVLDDFISFKKFTASKELLKFCVMCRHWSISMFILSQAYHRLPKTLRLNMSCIMFFKGSNKEVETLYFDYCPPGYGKKGFTEKIDEATQIKYSFLFIDLNRTIEQARYRICLDQQLI